jgi:predicted enzyme related to lactoylglutathione lyase
MQLVSSQLAINRSYDWALNHLAQTKKETIMLNAINWFEIPVSNLNRAAKFYNTILGADIQAQDMPGGGQMGFLPSEEGVGGAIVQGEGYVPSQQGALVYLNGGDDLSTVLSKVEAAGGKVLAPKTEIGEYGFIAFFADSEGNKVGLHSMK